MSTYAKKISSLWERPPPRIQSVLWLFQWEKIVSTKVVSLWCQMWGEGLWFKHQFVSSILTSSLTRTMIFLLILSLEVIPGSPNQDFIVAGADQCFLTPKLGGYGTKTFLEECEGLGERLLIMLSMCMIDLTFRQVHNSSEAPDRFKRIRNPPSRLLPNLWSSEGLWGK